MNDSREALYEAVSVPDALAAERTFLAAERTLLAYLRTGFAMFLAGVTGARLLADPFLVAVGYILATASLFVSLLGVVRFQRSKRATERMLSRDRVS